MSEKLLNYQPSSWEEKYKQAVYFVGGHFCMHQQARVTEKVSTNWTALWEVNVEIEHRSVSLGRTLKGRALDSEVEFPEGFQQSLETINVNGCGFYCHIMWYGVRLGFIYNWRQILYKLNYVTQQVYS